MQTIEAETLEQQNGHPTVSDATNPLRLNIGGGDVNPSGWVNVDRRYGLEAFPLNYPDGSVDEVRAVHVLEHLGYEDAVKALAEWVRVLKPGGRLRVAVPDLFYCMNEAASGNSDALRWIFGGQTDENDFHKNGFNEGGLRHLLAKSGLLSISKWTGDWGDCSELPCSLNLEGFKPTVSALGAAKGAKIHAVMSMPRLAFADNMFSALRVFTPLGIEFTRLTGAYWGECLERVITSIVEGPNAPDLIVTCDYDSVFTLSAFQRLAMLMDLHPELDAIVPLQAKRGKEGGIICKREKDVTVEETWVDVLPMDTGHFGLSFFRTAAFRRMPHPWLQSVPNKEGRWEDGRVDADIEFWHRWKACGNTMGLATRVGIGHAELLISWVDENFNVIHQHTNAYDEHGPPKSVWA